jgi:hypothetical protein
MTRVLIRERVLKELLELFLLNADAAKRSLINGAQTANALTAYSREIAKLEQEISDERNALEKVERSLSEALRKAGSAA